MSHASSSNGWAKQSGFIWSLIGSAVGFANVLSFSAHCYKNGGGAFLIPYVAALFMLGIPLLLLEGLIGNQWKEPLVGAFGRVKGVAGKTFGWLSVISCATIGGFYIVLTGYSVAYTYFAASSSIPEDTAHFFTRELLRLSPSIKEIGSFAWPVFMATTAVAFFSWMVLYRNVKDGIERICALFMPLLTLIMVGFAIVVSFLPHGIDGFSYYLKPDFSKIMDASLWRDVFGQLLFSLSLGIGIVVGYSRHTNEKIDVVKAMKWVAFGDFFVSFISGYAIFGCLAHMSATTGVSFDKLLTADSTFEIGFIVFPKILQHFGPLFSPMIGTLFFFCLFIAGVTGVFSIIESVAGNIEVEFSVTRKKAVAVTLIFTMTLASLFCMGNGSHLMDAIAPMVVGSNMLLGSLLLIWGFMYGSSKVAQHPAWERARFAKISLSYFIPALLALIFARTLFQELQAFNIGVAVRWIWFVLAFALSLKLSIKTKVQRVEPAYF
jgi:neurotransmitter:Na+ symporter, NSS family